MPGNRSFGALRTRIGRRIEAALDSDPRDGLATAREIMDERDERWYGLLLALSYDAVAEPPDVEPVVPAAAAIELLGGYCRLRGELLVQFDDTIAHSVTRDPTAALLAGDYLHSAAYSTLGAVDHPLLGDCFETLTTVSGRIVEAFGARYTRSVPPTTGHGSSVDETAGTLGEGAAVIGATLAGVDDALRDTFATLGRGLATSRQIRRALDPEATTLPVVPPDHDEQRLRQHARRRRGDTDRALADLASKAAVESLRAFGDPDDELRRPPG